MNCLPCFSTEKSNSEQDDDEEEKQLPVAEPKQVEAPLLPSQIPENRQTAEKRDISAKAYTFREMAIATKNFRQECVILDDGFAKVFKGTLKPSGEVVAIKQLDRNGIKGCKEFLDQVAALSPLKHPNLTSLVGYCADGDQRILVYEYMPLGSLESHLLERPADESPLDWVTRMKIATGAAQGLHYLHEEANPPLIFRDFRSSNILLDQEFNPRLWDFGLANFAESGNITGDVPPRVMGTYGYSAPEYATTGELTFKSDIYSFGVILLELISGRRAIDPDRPAKEQNLVTWARPIFRDPRRFPEVADPVLRLDFSVKSLNQAVAVAAMCLQEEPTVRPYITDVVTALSFLDFDANEPLSSSIEDGQQSENPSESINDDDDNEENINDDDNKSNSSSDDEENINDDDKCSSRWLDDEDDRGNQVLGADDHKDDDSGNQVLDDEDESGNISETQDDDDDDDDDDGASCWNDNGNSDDIKDDMSVYSLDDEDIALTIELDNGNNLSDYDQVEENIPIKSSNSNKAKVMEVSDDESIYSTSSSGSSVDQNKLGEKNTTQKTNSTNKTTSVGNVSRNKTNNRWRRAKLAINHQTQN